MIPSFAAITLGPFVQIAPDPNPNDLQINSYPGVNGLEILDLGSRGGLTHATGACVGSDLGELAAVEQAFLALQQAGVVGDLVDSLGLTWFNVRLLKFKPEGPIVQVPGYGWGRRCEWTFLHAT